MRNEYRVGPVFQSSLVVSGGMCAGLGIVALTALALHRVEYSQLLPASVPTSPVAALGFAACGLGLVGIGVWFPRMTSVLAVVTMSMVVSLAAEKVLGVGPRVEALFSANLGAKDWATLAPNTALVLLLGALALLVRHTRRWYESRLRAIAIIGSIIFAIGAVSCVGYMTGVPIYAWQPRAPMSFLSSICSCMLGMGIMMSACRYSELDEVGMPRWLAPAVCVGGLAVNIAAAVAYSCREPQDWLPTRVAALLPMIIVSAGLSAVAARRARQSTSA